ncbi:hypothetical protein ACC705_35850, partial [Rhizobium ruizarguesonis]
MVGANSGFSPTLVSIISSRLVLEFEQIQRFAGMTWRNILLQIEREARIPLSASLLEKSEHMLDLRLAQD